MPCKTMAARCLEKFNSEEPQRTATTHTTAHTTSTMGIKAQLFVNQKGTSTVLKQPKEIGRASRAQNGVCTLDDYSSLKYFYLADQSIEAHWDLQSGIKKFKDYELDFKDSLNSLQFILDSIQSNETNKGKQVACNVVAHCSTLVKLICCSFESSKVNPIDMRIVSFRGKLYIKDMISSYVEPSLKIFIPRKFETITTLPTPLAYMDRERLEKRHRKIVNNGDKFFSVCKTGVSNAKIVTANEISCIYDFKQQDNKNNLKHYCKLNCLPMITNINESHKFEYILLKDWLVAFIMGIPRLIYGFYDTGNNQLKTIEEFFTEEVPHLLKEHNSELTIKCTNSIKWYGLMMDWLLNIIPLDTNSNDIRPFKFFFEDNHLKLTEIESTDSEFDALVNGELILTENYKNWVKSTPIS